MLAASIGSVVGLAGRLRSAPSTRRSSPAMAGGAAWDRRAALLDLAAAAAREGRAAEAAGQDGDAAMLLGLADRLEWTASVESAAEAWDRLQTDR